MVNEQKCTHINYTYVRINVRFLAFIHDGYRMKLDNYKYCKQLWNTSSLSHYTTQSHIHSW